MSLYDSICAGILIISAFILIFLSGYLNRKKKKKQLDKIFIVIFVLFIIWVLGLALQIFFTNKLNINPIYFDYFVYIPVCYMPVAFLLMSLIFAKTKINFEKKYGLLFIIPTLSILLLWTNNMHHLFYKEYSTNISNTVFGNYIYVHYLYTYLLFGISLLILMKYSIKNSGFFSRQAILILIGAMVPIIINILGFSGIIPMSIYITPITFIFTIICLTFSMFKFNFLGAAPIALQRIVDKISDSYLVLDEDANIIDYNKTFLDTFKIKNNNIRGEQISTFLKETGIYLGIKDLSKALDEVRSSDKTITYEQTINKIKKTFMIEINSIDSDGTYIGTLILFKDITQHKEDMETIKNNQNILMERERLASLGQLIGGIAHNLKTPIMSIAGAAEGISDLVKEMDASVGNPVVTEEDFHEIAKDMNEWVVKIKSYSEYMSDIISAVKGQAVTLSNEEATDFTVVELFKRIDILMRHELKKSVVYLNSSLHVPESTSIKGDINSLVQVINNMISNAIQSYNGEPEKSIDLSAKLDGNNVVISVKDYGPGLPDKVKDKLFKEMITTKGKNGTGLGLYMSYSTIRAHFGGDITVDTEKNKGTTFNVVLPIAK